MVRVLFTPARRGTPSPGGVPEEHLRRRPPPATLCLCPVWFCRRRPPFFGRGKTAVGKGFRPIQLALGVELAEESAPGLQPDVVLCPIPQASPAGTGGGIPLGPIFPACSGP